MSELPLVSVITPCYNDGDYILECIASVLGSNYPNIEHIIVDDGSDNYTKTILSKVNYDKVRVIFKENEGVCKARNLAINESKGKYILPLDGDDKISPNYIGDAVKLLEGDTKIRFVTSEISQMFGLGNGQIIVKLPLNIGMLLSRNLFTVTTMFRKEDAIKIGGFDSDFKEGLEDWSFWISLVELGGDVDVVPGVNFYYRIKRKHRNSGFKDEERQRILYKLIWEKHKSLFGVYYADLFETYAYKTLKAYKESSLITIINIRIREFIKRAIGYKN